MNSFFEKYIGIILLVINVTIGLMTVKDYGMGFDERTSRDGGMITVNYVVKGDQKLMNYIARFYGVAIEVPLIAAEAVFGLKDTRDIFVMRHLLVHLFFLISAYFGFLLIDFLYENKLLAAIGFLLLVLSPRLYGHSFMNSKDIPFAGLFIICFYSIAISFYKKNFKPFIILGLLTGLLINTRILGVLILAAVLGLLIIDIILKQKEDVSRVKNIKLGATYVISSLGMLYASWPYLWKNPIINFAEAFSWMSKFRWSAFTVFNGKSILINDISWDYIPTLFMITNPIIYLVFGFFGILLLATHFIKKPLSFLQNDKKRNNLVFLACFFAPVLAIIILKSVVYDGWRHLFFIYPSFVLLAIYGLHFLFQTKFKPYVLALLGIGFCATAFFMVKNMPYQYVYFNQLVDTKTPEYLRSQYDLEYWGASYKGALEYILKNDSDAIIPVAAENWGALNNLGILKKEDRGRIKIVEERKEAKYFVTAYRWHPQDYTEYEAYKWHDIKVGNNTINSIFKLK